MSKTLRNRVNYFARHLKLPPNYMVKNRHIYEKEELPEDVKNLVDLTNAHRYGNKRKMRAKKKVHDRKTERAKGKEEFRNELEDIE